MTKDYGEKFIERLELERHRRGLSQGELGRLIGVSQRKISSWMTGESRVTIADAAAVAVSLGVSLDYLCAIGDESSESLSEEERAILKAHRLAKEIGWVKVAGQLEGGSNPPDKKGQREPTQRELNSIVPVIKAKKL